MGFEVDTVNSWSIQKSYVHSRCSMPSSIGYESVNRGKGQKLPNLRDVIYEPPLTRFLRSGSAP